MNITRRSLIQSAGIAAAAAAVVPNLAVADEAAEVELATTPWGKTYPWAAVPPVIADEQIEEELDCDVCVIGLGVSGVAAFRSAVEAGAKTIAFEKAEAPCIRSSQYAYINGTRSEALGLGTVDEDEVIMSEWNESAQVARFAIIREFVRNESDVIDWWMDGDPECYIPGPDDTSADGYGFGDPDTPHQVKGMVDLSVDYHAESQASYPTRISFKNHGGTVNANFQNACDQGGEAYFGHFGEQVITDETGRVVGAYIRNAETGMYKKVNAAKGVVCSMGGCGANKEYLEALFPIAAENGNLDAWPNFDVEGNPTDTGDVFPMGYWAGAAFSQNMCAMTHVMGGPNDVANMGTSSGLTSQHLRLNYRGERFMNEDSNVSDCEIALEKQPKRKAFSILDSHFDEQIVNCVTEFGSTLEAIEGKIDGETWFKADTLEELFDQIVAYDADFNKENALASVERYNALCETGRDDDFLKIEKYMFPVVDGPFYAQRFGIGLILTTMGGLASDEYAHVLDANLDPIPGFYVSGNSQGDRFAVKYPFKLSGASHAMAVYYGYVAGKNAASGEADKYVKAPVETAEDAPAAGGALADGTYEAAYNGIGGKVPVTVTVEGGAITAVEVGENAETQGIGTKAIEQLPELIVAANGTEGVDGVSGASVTSSAIFKGVEDCLAQAQA